MNRQQRSRTINLNPEAGFAHSAAMLESLASGITFAAQHGHIGMVTLLRGVASNRIALAAFVDRAAPITAADLKSSSHPVVALVGDDDDLTSGPAAWRCASVLAKWAASAVVHAAGATAQSYESAIVAAETHGNCAMIETNSTHAEKWSELFADKNVLLILPNGGVHSAAAATGHLR